MVADFRLTRLVAVLLLMTSVVLWRFSFADEKARRITNDGSKANRKDPSANSNEDESSRLNVLVCERKSAKERAIQHSLLKRMRFEFNSTPLWQVIASLQEDSGVQVVLDQRKLAVEEIPTDLPITASGTDVLFESVLDRILDPLNLTWLIRYEMLVVTTTVAAGEYLETQVYGIQDLLDAGNSSDEIIDLLSSTIDPESWDEVGGPGSMRPMGGLLAIRQTQRVHRAIFTLMTDMNRTAVRQRPERIGVHLPNKSTMVVQVYRTGAYSASQLVKAIETMIEPESWQSNGGDGRICFVESNFAFRPGAERTGGQKEAPPPSQLSDAILVENVTRVQSSIAKLVHALTNESRGFICTIGPITQESPTSK